MNVFSGEIAKKRYLKMRDIRVIDVLLMKYSMLQTFNKTNEKPKEHIKESTDHDVLFMFMECKYLSTTNRV